MVSLFLLIASGGGCWVTALMIDSNIDPAKMGRQMGESQSEAFREKGERGGLNIIIQEDSPATPGVPQELPEEILEVVRPN